MSKNCHFNRSYVRSTRTYTLSFKRLTKSQADFVCSVFRSLSSCGVVQVYQNGFTAPYYELRCCVPLARGFGRSLVVPHSVINEIVSDFGNHDFDKKDIIVNEIGVPLSNINTY